VREQSRSETGRSLRASVALLLCAFVAASGQRIARGDDAATVSPWATGGARIDAGSSDGKPGATQPAGVPIAQATPWPGYVIQGGAIPQGWQPQAVPYQMIGPDGRAVTHYYAPTYTFTYPVGPPVPMLAPVNRRQAVPQATYPAPVSGNGWNYRAQGAAPPTYALPPTVARYRPPPYQFPPSAPQLTGQPLAPPNAPLPQPAFTSPPPPSSWQAQPLQSPPAQWAPSAPVTPPPHAAGQFAAAAAPAMIAGATGAAGAAAAAQPDPPPAPAGMPSPPMQAVSASPTTSAPWQQPVSDGRSPNSHMWRVVGVHDGDTLTCLDENNQQQKVRLAEIDAPELGQDFGKVSREALASMVFGKTVEVVDEGKDRYGRWIGHVLVNGTDVNRELVATGNAWHYAAYSKDKSLAQLQADARGKQIGLWAQPSPVAPWQFRANENKT
jgi:micrococcal nuclease